MLSEGTGRLYDLATPSGTYVNLGRASGVTFFGYEVDGATQYTITFSNNASGSSTSTPDVIDHYYGKSLDQSSGAWHRTAVSPASETITVADVTEDMVVIEISAAMCPDGKPYVKCVADGGIVVAVVHDLARQGSPEKLAGITA